MTKEEALKVSELCIELLTPKEKWNKNSVFGEKCLINAPAFSLGCALELMQISVMGKAESRNLVMRRVRGKIRRHFFWRQGWHPITKFNHHKKTTYEDVIFLLEQVRDSFKED